MSDSESPPSFSSVEEECAYWKEQYASKRQEATELEDELEEFQATSREIESMMEKEVQEAEKKSGQIQSMFDSFKLESEEKVRKVRKRVNELQERDTKTQGELEKVKTELLELRELKQKLEQENDDLERRDRELNATVSYLNDRLEQVTEEHVMIQTEFEDFKVKSQEVTQRLKEELRDQKQETYSVRSQLQSVTHTFLQPRKHRGKLVSSLSSSTTPYNRTPIGMVSDMILLVKELERNMTPDQEIMSTDKLPRRRYASKSLSAVPGHIK